MKLNFQYQEPARQLNVSSYSALPEESICPTVLWINQNFAQEQLRVGISREKLKVTCSPIFLSASYAQLFIARDIIICFRSFNKKRFLQSPTAVQKRLLIVDCNHNRVAIITFICCKMSLGRAVDIVVILWVCRFYHGSRSSISQVLQVLLWVLYIRSRG